MKFILCLRLIICTSPLFSQFHHTDDIKEMIHLRMLRFYGYSGNWTVTVKEWAHGRDTIFFHGTAEGRIKTNEDIQKDSSHLAFDLTWKSSFDRETTDMSGIDIVYHWRDDSFGIMLTHLPKNGTWVSSLYSINANESIDVNEVIESMKFYPEESRKERHPVPFSEWTFQDDKILLVLHQRRMDESIRMRMFVFERTQE
jgi:hypothetical protein